MWYNLFEDSDLWRALVNRIIYYPVPQNAQSFLTTWELLTS